MSARQRPPVWPALGGLLALAIGTVPLLGWLLDRPGWIRLDPSLEPIHFGTAVGLALSGLALILAAFRVALPMVRAIGVLTLLAAAWTLGELVMGVGSLLELPRFPGTRGGVPPNAALALVLAGIGLANVGRRPFLVAALGAFAASLGGVALLGHLAGIETAITSGANDRMALPAALGFTLLGAGMWAVSRREERAADTPESWHRPILGGLAILAGTFLFWQALSRYEARQLRQTLDWAAEQIAAETEVRLDGEFQALAALDPEAFELEDPDRLDWRRRAESLLDTHPGLRAAAWIDVDGSIEPSQPPGWPARSLADLIVNDESLERRLELARGSRRPFVYGPISLEVGVLSFWFLAPADRFGARGVIAGLYDTRALFDEVLAEVAPDYGLSVVSGERELYRRSVRGPSTPAGLARRAPLDVDADAGWAVRVLPSRVVLERHDSRLGLVILVVGGALALVLTAALYLRQMALAQADALRLANATLREQVERSRAAEREVRSLNEELEARVGERTEELRRSNDDLRQFASFASHELRQPLGTLVVWLDLLKTTQGEALGEEGQRYVRQMEDEARRMRDLIETQLRWAEASAEELIPDWFSVRDVVDELESDLSLKLTECGGRVEAGELPEVRADRRQLYNVLRNLFENAIKYRREAVPLVIRIHAAPPDAAEWPRPMACVLRFADNGQGFAPEESETIFRLFERLHPSTEGSGIGLAICRRIVERLGGAIRAEGRPGEGATFFVALPEARVDDCSSGATPPATDTSGP